MGSRYGVVEYFGLGDGHRCGYCKGSTTNISHGMWAHALLCENYEDLINRGWRRSGKYVYKPLMTETCCPQYATRCDVANVKLSKSQKKVLKRMNNFLQRGVGKPEKKEDEPISKSDLPSCNSESASHHGQIDEKLQMTSVAVISMDSKSPSKEITTKESYVPLHKEQATTKADADSTKPRCRKAKEIRKERKLQKLRARAEGKSLDQCVIESTKTNENQPKSIEDYIESSLPSDSMLHKLEVKTVRSYPESHELEESLKAEFTLFRRYQVAIHKETEDENTRDQFKRFLVNSPLEPVYPDSAMTPWTGLGSFHQQYYLDGKLIAVGVLDILPHCISSKYFFYDPDYDFLSLGTYSALREIYFMRSLQRTCPSMKYYYMGYYIHSCPKMRYKGQYYPSYLLCPENYTFVPIENCVSKLDKNKYARLADESLEDEKAGSIDQALVLHHHRAMPYKLFEHSIKSSHERKEQRVQVTEYVSLVGTKVAGSILLFRKTGDSDWDSD